MTRLNSFHISPNVWPSLPGDTVVLDGPEARHMLTVLRTAKDQTVRLFDGNGYEGLFRVTSVSKKNATLEALELHQCPAPKSGVTLAIGWGKSKRRNYFFEKLVELKGVGVVFWAACRSQGTMPSTPKPAWNDKCIQAAKQCGNAYLPDVQMLESGIDDLLDLARSYDQCYLAWESEEANQPLSPAHLVKGNNLIVIGPEGGLELKEAETLIAAGVIPVTLGDSILRWETAASYCLSLAHFARQEKE